MEKLTITVQTRQPKAVTFHIAELTKNDGRWIAQHILPSGCYIIWQGPVSTDISVEYAASETIKALRAAIANF